MFQVPPVPVVQRFSGTNCSKDCAKEVLLTEVYVAEGWGQMAQSKQQGRTLQ